MTLIEILVAMLILSIASSALLMAMARALSVVNTARKLDVARSLIERVDLEFPIESVDMNEISESGTFEDVEGYTWYRDIQMVDMEERPGLFEVTTRVVWSQKGRESFEEITAYRYAPDAEVITSQF
jgi:prepilin-type N-terminal cleavage/methylation domain-containing protein